MFARFSREFAVSRWSTRRIRTYWECTRPRLPRREGMRIEFVLGSPAPAARVDGALIDRDQRKGTGAGDHVPVVVDLTGPPGP